MLIFGLIGFGLLIGWLAQLIVGNGTRLNGRSLVAGLVGSFVGGLLVSLLAGDGLKFKPSGLLGSLGGAIVVLLIWGAFDKSTAKKNAQLKKESRSGDPRKRAHRTS